MQQLDSPARTTRSWRVRPVPGKVGFQPHRRTVRYSRWCCGSAPIVATFLGIPIGVLTGTARRGPYLVAARAASSSALSLPRSFCRWLCSSSRHEPDGFPSAVCRRVERRETFVISSYRCWRWRCLSRRRWNEFSLGLFPRLSATVDARSARARPSRRRVVWGHAFRLSLTPVLAVYGVVIGALISGSFIVEYVMTWPGTRATDVRRPPLPRRQPGCRVRGHRRRLPRRGRVHLGRPARRRRSRRGDLA